MFDVTMGAPDGAEVCELVGLFLLSEIRSEFPELNCGLYRDDGLAEHRRIPGRRMEAIRQGLHELFKRHGLKITIDPHPLNMETGHYCPTTAPLQKAQRQTNIRAQQIKSPTKRAGNRYQSQSTKDSPA